MKPQNLVVFIKTLKTEDLCGTSNKYFFIKRKIQAYLLLHYTTFAHPASSCKKKSLFQPTLSGNLLDDDQPRSGCGKKRLRMAPPKQDQLQDRTHEHEAVGCL